MCKSCVTYLLTYKIDLGVDLTIFEAEELENDEAIYAELKRDLDSDCDVTIPVTFRISLNANDTGLMQCWC